MAFARIAPERPWRGIGGLGVLIAFIILAYYAVIAGWALKYLAMYVTGAARTAGSEGYDVLFQRFISEPLEPLIWQFLVIAVFAGWRWLRADALAACDLREGMLGRAWRLSLRLLVPLLVLVVLLRSLRALL